MDEIDAKARSFGSPSELRAALLGSPEYLSQSPGGATLIPRSGVVIVEIAAGLRLFVDLADRAIGLNIIGGAYEEHEIRFAKSQIRRGDSVVDVGANVGFFTVQMADWVGDSGSVLALEPIPDNLELLERSIAENDLGARVRVAAAAAAEAPGRASLASADPSLGFDSDGASLRAGGVPVPEHHALHETVKVRLDDFGVARPVSFVRMDVDGAEGVVVRGAREILSEDRPTILMKIAPEQLCGISGESPAELIRSLESMGFACHQLEGERPGARIHDVHTLCNVVFRHHDGRKRPGNEVEDRVVERAPPVETELVKDERAALDRLKRRSLDAAAKEDAPNRSDVSLASFRELEHQLRHYMGFHEAVRSSVVWRIAQKLRGLVGREW